MNVVFLHEGGESFATYRYRCLIPSKNIEGHSISLNAGPMNALVVSKPSEFSVDAAKHAKEAGVKIVVDVADDHLEKPIYQEALSLADHIVASSAALAEKIGGDVTVIEDPYEFDLIEPHANGSRGMWFGRIGNLEPMFRWYPYFHKYLDSVTVLCEPNNSIPHVPWSIENMMKFGRMSNIALLPTSEMNKCKSANRLVNALALGLFPVCGHNHAFDEFKKMAWVGKFYGGLQFARANASILNELVAEGQEYIAERYSPKAVGKKWQNLFDSI